MMTYQVGLFAGLFSDSLFGSETATEFGPCEAIGGGNVCANFNARNDRVGQDNAVEDASALKGEVYPARDGAAANVDADKPRARLTLAF